MKMLKRILLCFFFCFFINVLFGFEEPGRANKVRRKIRYKSNTSINLTTPYPDLDHEAIDEEILESASLLNILHKINDRLTALATLNDQQSRRFENLEYRLTKLEVQNQEKTDGLRSDLKEMLRRVQQLDWQSSKTESALETLKSDSSFLKQAIEHYRIAPIPDSNLGSGSDVGLDLTNKLQMVLRTVQTLLNGFTTLQSDVAVLRRNLTKISNSSKLLEATLPLLLTTKHFQQSLLALERRSSFHPVSSVCAAGNVAVFSEGLPQDCSEVPSNKSAVYRIQPPHSPTPFFVYCDLETNGGGWTVVQKRAEGTLEFYRGWHDYKHGFGNIGGEFWLGLEKIHSLTNYKVNELYIELEDFSLQKTFAHYSAFAVGSEVEGYPISFLGSYQGTAGDSLIYHAGQKFSTFDVDHDNWAEGNCAQSHDGAWWYNGCDTSNLNGRYLSGEIPDQYEYQGMYWYDWRGPKYSLKGTKIMIRPLKAAPSHLQNQSSTAFEQDYLNILNNNDDS